MRTLTEQFRHSSVTVSRALQELCARKRLRCVPRSGYFLLTDDPPKYTWGLILRITPSLWQPTLCKTIADAFESVFRLEKSEILLDPCEWSSEVSAVKFRRQLLRAKNSGMNGLFLLPSGTSDLHTRQEEAMLEVCRKSGIPVVLLERNLRGHDNLTHWDVVGADDFTGGRQCARHLLEIGKRRIAFVAGSPVNSHERRLAGYLFELFRHNQAHPRDLAESLMLDQQDGSLSIARQLLDAQADGVICYQDYIALGVIQDLLLQGAAVASNIAIMGFDNLPVSEAFSISTYALPYELIAKNALARMLQRIESPQLAPIRIESPGSIILRKSSVKR